MITIGTIFVNRPRTIDIFLECFKRLKKTKDTRAVWLDISYNPEITKKLKDFIKENKDIEILYLDSSLKKLKNVKKVGTFDSGLYDMDLRRRTVAESMQILNNHRIGDLVIWEDDIIVPEDALEKMIKVKSIATMITCCQYERNSYGKKLHNPDLLAFDFIKSKVFPGDSCQEYKISLNNVMEKNSGYDYIGASATGFVLIKENFIKNYNYIESQEKYMKEYGSTGQDLILSWNISEGGKKQEILIDWSIKAIHIDERDDKIQIICKPHAREITPVYFPEGWTDENWTIATVFLGKISIKKWLDCFENLDIPRDKFKVIWLDISKNKEIEKLLKHHKKRNESDFKKFIYIKDDDTPFVKDRCSGKNREERGFLISKNYQRINELRSGHLLLLEDDIIVPKDAFRKMVGVFNISNLNMVNCVQCERDMGEDPRLLVWRFGEHNNLIRQNMLKKGVSYVQASGTGFTMIRKDFLDNYDYNKVLYITRSFVPGLCGQDVIISLFLKNREHLMNWDVRATHMGEKNGEVTYHEKPLL